VLARRGYRAAGRRSPPPMKVPASLTPQLRTLLAGVMPEDQLPMRVQAVPVSRDGKKITVAVIVEVNGAALATALRERTLNVEQGLLSVNSAGKADNGVRRRFEITLSAAQRQVLGETSLRSIWAIDLPAGRHQLRVASVDSTTGRAGSVYLDVNLPGGEELPPGVLIASRLLSVMPTVFVDGRLARWTAVMPTATRTFPAGDVLTVTVPHTAASATARLSNEGGEVVWTGSASPVVNASGAQFAVPLDRVTSPVGEVTIDGSHGVVRTRIGIASSQTRKEER
jgi:hypothetical protein